MTISMAAGTGPWETRGQVQPLSTSGPPWWGSRSGRVQLGEGLPRAQVALGLSQCLQHLARRADVGRPVDLALFALGVRLHLCEEARAMVVHVPRKDRVVEAGSAARRAVRQCANGRRPCGSRCRSCSSPGRCLYCLGGATWRTPPCTVTPAARPLGSLRTQRRCQNGSLARRRGRRPADALEPAAVSSPKRGRRNRRVKGAVPSHGSRGHLLSVPCVFRRKRTVGAERRLCLRKASSIAPPSGDSREQSTTSCRHSTLGPSDGWEPHL